MSHHLYNLYLSRHPRLPSTLLTCEVKSSQTRVFMQSHYLVSHAAVNLQSRPRTVKSHWNSKVVTLSSIGYVLYFSTNYFLTCQTAMLGQWELRALPNQDYTDAGQQGIFQEQAGWWCCTWQEIPTVPFSWACSNTSHSALNLFGFLFLITDATSWLLV
jgi:hypothetical protein